MAYAMPSRAGRRFNPWFAAVALGGAALSVFLGVYANVHTPTGRTTFGFSSGEMLAFKSWFTTLVVVLAGVQVASALRLYDRIRWPRQIPLWLGNVHRLSGTLALLASLPVAYHCLWSLGYKFGGGGQPRVLLHAVAGCFFYGIFVVKVASVRLDPLPAWLVPALGGSTAALLVVIWLTSAAYFFTGRLGG